jgi:hypothetical protein
MAIERWSDMDIYTWSDAGDVGHDSRKVTLEV